MFTNQEIKVVSNQLQFLCDVLLSQVVLEGSFSEPNDLVGLYGFRTEYIKSSSDYHSKY